MTEYKGMRFATLYETDRVKRAVVEFSESEKLRLDEGKLAIVLTQDSYKYGPEFQIQYWTRKKPVIHTDRTPDHNGYYRMVIYLTPEEGKNMVRGLLGR